MNVVVRTRASSEPTFEACPRLWAGRHAEQIPLQRVNLRRIKQHVGAAVGTATHTGGEYLMREFKRTGEVGGTERSRQAREAALEKFPDELEFDSVTPGPGAAVEAVGKLVTVYHGHIDPTIEPLLIERGLTMTVGEDLVITGHLDLVLVDLVPTDLKTGRHTPRAASQYGSYFLLLRANAATIGLDERKLKPYFRQTYLPRVPASKPPKSPVVTEFPQGALERQALSTARQIRRCVQEYRETGDIEAFPARPNSWLCSPNFCPLFGSTDGACDSWRLSAAARKEGS